MTYAVKEIFYTLQGEGANTGRPAVFCRFAGCNLWSGRESDREEAVCRFCDTDFVGTDGPGGGKFATAEDLAARRCSDLAPPGRRCPTPRRLHRRRATASARPAAPGGATRAGFEVAVETNGTVAPPDGIDWLCVSPKAEADLVVRAGDELKLVYPQEGASPSNSRTSTSPISSCSRWTARSARPTPRRRFDYCLSHPRWRLSLQTHKLLGIP